MSFWGSMEGSDGQVVVPSIGAVVGKIVRWTLRREESGAADGLRPLTLRASFSFVNEFLINEPDVKKQIIITIRKGKHYVVTGERMVFDGTVLKMEDCKLERPDEEA